jgi:DNA-binding PadR family transcriptional regulator
MQHMHRSGFREGFRPDGAPDFSPGRGRHRGPHHRPGDMPFGFREAFGRGRPGRPGVRRGEIRPLILSALQARPMHGYEVIQELEARSGGRWRPSAGSIYPTLQQLTDEGLVTSEEVDGRRTYTLSDAGRTAAEAASASRPTWDEPTAEADVRGVAMELVRAAMQVQSVGSSRARGEATQLLTETRRKLYRILADDEAVGTPEGSDEPSSPTV